MRRGPSFDYAEIRRLCEIMSKDAVARRVGCSLATVTKVVGKIGPGESKRAPRGMRTSARFSHRPLTGMAARMPAFDNPALMESRTVFSSTVTPASEADRILKSGKNAGKIGGIIRKGRWSGVPVFTLTLEERATCPKSCAHWRSCFGNNMHLAQRIRDDGMLTARLSAELDDLSARYERYAIRLHVLGDFMSVAYVEFWRDMLQAHPGLRVFGFTARIDFGIDPVADILAETVRQNWARFAIRFSNAPLSGCATVSIEHPFQKPADAIICPAQVGKTESCSTCALCWATTKRIAFLQH